MGDIHPLWPARRPKLTGLSIPVLHGRRHKLVDGMLREGVHRPELDRVGGTGETIRARDVGVASRGL